MYTISEGVWVFKQVPHCDWAYFILGISKNKCISNTDYRLMSH